MIEQDDSAGRAGSAGLSPIGVGHSCARHCMPCNRFVLNQVGGRPFTWRGARNVWHCADCKAKREARAVAATGAEQEVA